MIVTMMMLVMIMTMIMVVMLMRVWIKSILAIGFMSK